MPSLTENSVNFSNFEIPFRLFYVLTYNRNIFFVLAFVVAIYDCYREFLRWLVGGSSRISVLSLICSYTSVSAKKTAKQHNKLTARMLMYLFIYPSFGMYGD